MPMTAFDEHMMKYVPQQFQLAVQSLVYDADNHTYTVEYRTAYKDGMFLMETKTFTAIQAITRHFSAIRKVERIMESMNLAVVYDELSKQYKIYDKADPDTVLQYADSKESAYTQMLELAIRKSIIVDVKG